MNLEDYFDFHSPDDIRVKGSRVGIESVLYDYIYRDWSAETIVKHYPTLTLEEVYATILYYHHNREKVEAYLLEWMNAANKAREEQAENPPPVVLRLRELKAERDKTQPVA